MKLKRNHLSFGVIAISIAILTSCFGPDHSITTTYKSYIREYVEYDDDIILSYGEKNNNNNHINSKTISVLYIDSAVIARHRFVYGNPVKDEYDILSEENNDITYNKSVNSSKDRKWRSCIARNYEKIEIFSDSDFDKEHKAGTLLNDIVKVHYATFKPFIDANYQPEKEEGHDYVRLTKMASEIESDDMHIIPNYYPSIVELEFIKLPENKTPHNITVKLYSTRDEVFTESITIEDF